MEKPQHRFYRDKDNFIHVGMRALVVKPHDDGAVTSTSKVLEIREDGSFETLNSIYIPVNKPNT